MCYIKETMILPTHAHSHFQQGKNGSPSSCWQRLDLSYADHVEPFKCSFMNT